MDVIGLAFASYEIRERQRIGRSLIASAVDETNGMAAQLPFEQRPWAAVAHMDSFDSMSSASAHPGELTSSTPLEADPCGQTSWEPRDD